MGKSRPRCDYVLPSAPPLSEYEGCSPYGEIDIPPPPRIPLPDLPISGGQPSRNPMMRAPPPKFHFTEIPPPGIPPPELFPHPPKTSLPTTSSSSSNISTNSRGLLIGERAANFDVPFSKIKKRQINPNKSFNPLILTRRGCTDVICSFLLILFIAGWAVVAAFGFMWGKPERLIHPTDSLGRTCGHSRPGAYDFTDKKYLFFFDLTKCVSYTTFLTGCPTPQICVEKCPTQYFSYLQLQFVPSGPNFISEVQKNVICRDPYNIAQITNWDTLRSAVESDWCAPYTVKSSAVLGRCFPQVFIDPEGALKNAGAPNSTLDKIISSVGNQGNLVPSDSKINESTVIVNGVVNTRAVLQKIVADLSVSWYQILVFFVISGVISFLWTVILRIFGGLMIWFSIFLLLGLLAGGSGYCWYRYYLLHESGAVNDYSFQPVFYLYFEMPTTWMIFGIILSLLLLIIFIIFLFVRSRIKLAVAVIEETSRALGSMLSTLFFPIFPFGLHIIVFGIFGSIAIWLASSGEENCRILDPQNPLQLESGTPCDCDLLGTPSMGNCRYVNLTRNSETVTYFQFYNLFACFWMTCFVSGLSDVTLAGAFGSYYWAFRKPKDVPSFPVLRSLGRALRYHLGSLAFGSLILSIVKFIRAILEFLYQKLHASQNKVAKTIFMILKCFFFCLETVLRALTTNAYIMIAIYGTNFFSSARDSFSLITRNIIRTVVLNRVVTFLMFVGKATITLGMGLVSFYWFSGRWVIDGFPQVTLYYYFVPVIVIIIGTYCICDLFFEVFEMGVDTIFLCFLEDSETNDGTEAKPFYMSEELKKIYNKENKF
ncbi:hypothetical protein FO519_004096 [Halicephalobus sp. NKZ332]|nr:hypothetical protein FO519_004096 [Halicephalobus sp. NKZ332]